MSGRLGDEPPAQVFKGVLLGHLGGIGAPLYARQRDSCRRSASSIASPPHSHALYGEHRARVSISTGEVIDGELPQRAVRLVREWAELHRSELERNWSLAEAMQPLETIEPLP